MKCIVKLIGSSTRRQVRSFFRLALFTWVGLLSLPSFSFGQTYDNAKLDSLKLALKNAKADTDRVELMVLIAQEVDCSDTTTKLSYANKALALADKLGNSRSLLLALENLGNTFTRCCHSPQRALHYYDRYALLAEESADYTAKSLAYQQLAYYYDGINKYDLAIQFWKKYVHLLPDAAAGWGNLGSAYTKIADFPKALECYTKALAIEKRRFGSDKSLNITDSLQMAGLLLTTSMMYQSMKEYEKSIEYDNKALQYIPGSDYGSKYVRFIAYLSIGSTNESLNSYDIAKTFYDKALDIASELNDEKNKMSALWRLANIHLKLRQPKLALESGLSALALSSSVGDNFETPSVYFTLGKIYAYTKQYPLAVTYLNKAISLSHETGILDAESEAWEQLHKVYGAMERPNDALMAYKAHISLRDSIYSVNKAKEMTRIDVAAKYNQIIILDSIKNLKKTTDLKIRVQRQRLLSVGGYLGLGVVLLLAFFIYRNYGRQKQANVLISDANMQLQLANEKIREESEISDNLLLNILPEEVATELKREGNVTAKLFRNVTVMFTDFVNFTEAGERMTPDKLVAELHNCFSEFDKIVGRYNIEKIKTVGDAYLAVSGLPHAKPTHAKDMIDAALEIRDFMKDRKQQYGDNTFDVRIGINSGEVVAGIVGVKKFAYDIWGDTVNIAARMEQNSEANKINVSEATYSIAKESFSFEFRGEITAKNKGSMKMYFAEKS